MNQPRHDTLSIVDDTRIDEISEIITPRELVNKYPLNERIEEFISLSRRSVSNIINLTDHRLLVITWPCSIHNQDEAIEYAKLLQKIKEKNPHLFLVMRTYFEKPRTTIWWKWLINDPHLDGSCDINTWLEIARDLLLKINSMWIPTAIEFLDTITPQYIWDLVTWWAIWARTVESQEHRKLASWLSMPIWFKNWTTWDLQIAIDAIKSASKSHTFLSVTKEWKVAKVTTTWNSDWHIILRWGSSWPNYSEEHVLRTINELKKSWINTWIMIDFSHNNSWKRCSNQPIVCEAVAKQIENWNKRIIWIMIEWNINAWNQSFIPGEDDKSTIKYWVSITDECVDWQTNSEMISRLNEAKKKNN